MGVGFGSLHWILVVDVGIVVGIGCVIVGCGFWHLEWGLSVGCWVGALGVGVDVWTEC